MAPIARELRAGVGFINDLASRRKVASVPFWCEFKTMLSRHAAYLRHSKSVVGDGKTVEIEYLGARFELNSAGIIIGHLSQARGYEVSELEVLEHYVKDDSVI